MTNKASDRPGSGNVDITHDLCSLILPRGSKSVHKNWRAFVSMGAYQRKNLSQNYSSIATENKTNC